MTERQLRWLLATYPRAWRARYREEIEVLAEDMWSSGETTHARLVVDLLLGGVAARGRWVRTWFRRSLVLPLGAAVMVGVALVALTTSGPVPVRARSDVVLTTGALRSFGATFGLRTFPARVALKSGTGVDGFVQRGTVLGSGSSGSGTGPGDAVPVFSVSGTDPLGDVLPIRGFAGFDASDPSCADGVRGSSVASSCAVGLPDLVGEPTPTAAARLSALGIAVTVANVSCAPDQAGHVGAMTPPAGSSFSPSGLVAIDNCV